MVYILYSSTIILKYISLSKLFVMNDSFISSGFEASFKNVVEERDELKRINSGKYEETATRIPLIQVGAGKTQITDVMTALVNSGLNLNAPLFKCL